jgi:hypothetical protein
VKFVARRIFFFVVLSMGVIANAQDWTTIQTAAPNIQFFIDLNSAEREDDLVIFKERLTYTIADKIDPASGMAIKEKLVKRVMDCAKRTQGMLSGSMRSDTGSLIEMVTVDRAQMVMAPIPHGTLAEQELEMVCKKSSAAPAK